MCYKGRQGDTAVFRLRSCNTVPSSVARMHVRNSACEDITTVYTHREVGSRRLLLPSTVI